MKHTDVPTTFIPALQYPFLTSCYDLVLTISGLGKGFKQKISDIAQLPELPGGVIIDVGCGSGLHAKLLAKRYPQMKVIGFDPDPQLIKKLQEKNNFSNLEFHEGFAQQIDLPDNSVMYVFSSLTYHHLTSADKIRAAQETNRVLVKNGEFIFTDWGTLFHPFFRYYLYLVETKRCIDDHFNNRVLGIIQDSGFSLRQSQKVKRTGIWLHRFVKSN